METIPCTGFSKEWDGMFDTDFREILMWVWACFITFCLQGFMLSLKENTRKIVRRDQMHTT